MLENTSERKPVLWQILHSVVIVTVILIITKISKMSISPKKTEAAVQIDRNTSGKLSLRPLEQDF